METKRQAIKDHKGTEEELKKLNQKISEIRSDIKKMKEIAKLKPFKEELSKLFYSV